MVFVYILTRASFSYTVMSSRFRSHLVSSEKPSTQNSGEMDSEELATLTSTVLVEATDPRDSAHEATPTGIHDYECFIMLFISYKV